MSEEDHPLFSTVGGSDTPPLLSTSKRVMGVSHENFEVNNGLGRVGLPRSSSAVVQPNANNPSHHYHHQQHHYQPNHSSTSSSNGNGVVSSIYPNPYSDYNVGTPSPYYSASGKFNSLTHNKSGHPRFQQQQQPNDYNTVYIRDKLLHDSDIPESCV